MRGGLRLFLYWKSVFLEHPNAHIVLYCIVARIVVDIVVGASASEYVHFHKLGELPTYPAELPIV